MHCLSELFTMSALTLLLLLPYALSNYVTVKNSQVDISDYESTTLSCNLKSTCEPLQITWQKEDTVGPENIGTISKTYGSLIQDKWKHKVSINSSEDQKQSHLIFIQATKDVVGCYMCLFNCFGMGKLSGKACLDLIARPVIESNFTHGENGSRIYFCRSRSLPESAIEFNISHAEIHYQTFRTHNFIEVNAWARVEAQEMPTVVCSIKWLNTNKNIFFEQIVIPTKHLQKRKYLVLTLCCTLYSVLIIVLLLLYFNKPIKNFCRDLCNHKVNN